MHPASPRAPARLLHRSPACASGVQTVPAHTLRCPSTCRSLSGIAFPLRDNRKTRLCKDPLCNIYDSCKNACSLDEPFTGGMPLRNHDCSIQPPCFSPILFSAIAQQTRPSLLQHSFFLLSFLSTKTPTAPCGLDGQWMTPG